jgi:hypothetical protein
MVIQVEQRNMKFVANAVQACHTKL